MILLVEDPPDVIEADEALFGEPSPEPLVPVDLLGMMLVGVGRIQGPGKGPEFHLPLLGNLRLEEGEDGPCG